MSAEAVAARRVAREVALEVRSFVAARYPEMVPGLAVASDDGLWMRYRGEFVEHEEAAAGQSRVVEVLDPEDRPEDEPVCVHGAPMDPWETECGCRGAAGGGR